jgi:hypothetical protein
MKTDEVSCSEGLDVFSGGLEPGSPSWTGVLKIIKAYWY